MSECPVDETTLVLIEAAMDSHTFEDGMSHLHDFLDMGSREKSSTRIGEATDGTPIYEVEYEEGYEPLLPTDVIRALIAEVRRLRGNKGEPG